MRIKKMIKRDNSLIFFQILSTFFKEMYGENSHVDISGAAGLKGFQL